MTTTSIRNLISHEDLTSAIAIAIKNIMAEKSTVHAEIMIERDAVNNLYLIYLDFCMMNSIKPITLKRMEHWHFVDSQKLKKSKEEEKA